MRRSTRRPRLMPASIPALLHLLAVLRAGADFALSVGQVASQLLAFQLLGEESVSLEP